MRVLARDGEHETEIQRSRFRCRLTRVTDADAAAEVVAAVRREHWSASHHCTALRIGPAAEIQRSSDDGEPAGTAGVPMLEVLTRRELTDVVAVVTRWFGGTKLGAGGLVRAYGSAVSEALDVIGTHRRARHTELLLAVPHADAGRLENAVRANGIRVTGVEYGGDVAIAVQVPDATAFHTWLAERTGGAVEAIETGTTDVEIADR
ncbi:YigZ family protein [Pseudonocardia ailaonensis]|uniref:YigZ family protein n=1 Tax=Pseudonocardia ailaonensis TaxID=367279 RepID=UPI0031DFE93A